MASPPVVILETSAALAYLNMECESAAVGKLVQLAERSKIVLLMSDFAWQQTDSARYQDSDRYARLAALVEHLPKVARLDEWVLGEDMLGHDSSDEIQRALPSGVRSDRPDLEQFLSYCAKSRAAFFVTKDDGFFKESAQLNVHAKFGFRVGRPEACLEWLKENGIL
jgi:hypothetical protein